MPDRTEDDYRLAARGMGGAYSAQFQRTTTGYWFLERCPGCAVFLTGVEYLPEPSYVAPQSDQPGGVVYDRFVAWYAGQRGERTA
jgi:hypothetical protein